MVEILALVLLHDEQMVLAAVDDTLRCPTCSRPERNVDWTFLENDWKFGNLGFGFHNWPIADFFAQGLAGVLGHRVKLAYQGY